MKKKVIRPLYVVAGIFAVLILVFTIFWCRRAISRELQIQVKENLYEVAMQSVLTLESGIENKQNLVKSLAGQFNEVVLENPTELLSTSVPLMGIYHLKRIGFIYPDGKAYTSDGYIQDLSFREYFKQGMEGRSFISGVMMDTIGEEENINVFSVPVYNRTGSEVAGVLFVTYRTSMFQSLMNVNSFDGEGYSYVVQDNGTVVAGSPHSEMRVQNNILSYLEKIDSANKTVVKKMRSAMHAGETGTAKFKLDSANYVHYTPIRHSFDNQPCYLLTIVPEKLLSERISPVLLYINIMLFIILCVLGGIVFTYILSYQRGKAELLQLAYEDSLTGGDNFACFELKMENRKWAPGFMIAMDLSEFKIINNTCGVEMGNETLRRVWLILRKVVRKGELAAHINADRFVLFVEEVSQEELVGRIGQITDMVSGLSGELNIPKLSIYFGIYPMDSEESTKLAFGRANEAKHLVKGRRDTNYAFYDEVDFQQIIEARELEDRFEQAIANREFEVWYQPKYSTDSARIVGAEALTRWRNSDGSLIPPFKFIPLFEQNGMISILDEYVFETVCRQQKDWEHAGMPMLPVSINISRTSLYYSNVVERYKGIAEKYAVEERYVPLEITESATIDNQEIRDLIDQFHAAGFPLLLDDFGNGYSSLATLNIMDFDILKLDKSLIDYIGDEKGEKLLFHIIKLAKSLGMEVTAEGVEYKEQVEFLQQLKCNDIQGFYFSKPLPIEEYQKRMEEGIA